MKTIFIVLAFAALVAATTATTAALADVDNQLVFRRKSGDVITFPATAKAFVWCGPYESDGDPATPTFHVIVYDTTLTDATYWRLWAIPADVTIGEPQRFPNHWQWPNPDSVEIFVGDPPNEAATDTEDAGGSITFTKLDCVDESGDGGGVEFTIDARVGSEFGDGPWIDVTGSFRGRLTGNPFTPARPATWGALKSTYR